MRITSGLARGILLDVPRTDAVRPATDAARQAIFSSLGSAVEGASVLDLFAGTGSYGLEAASRGAAAATFAETDRLALAALRRNIERVKKAAAGAGAEFSARIVPCDCVKSASLFESARYDIVFADPPYAMLCDPKTSVKIFSMFCKICREDMFFVLEAPADFSLENAPKPFAFEFEQLRRLGKKSAGKPSQIIFKIKSK